MRRPIAIAGVVGLLALGGTAIAAPGGGPLGGILGGDRDDRRAELARDLGEKLNVSPDRVEQALGEVESERQAEHRKQKAEDLAANLDGVSAAQAEKALEKLEKEREAAREDREPGERPDRGAHLESLAKELGKTTAEVRAALEKSHKARAAARVDEALKDGRITKEQADEIKKRIESGQFRGRHGGPGHGRGGPGHGRGGPGGFDGGPPAGDTEDGAAGDPPVEVDPA